MAAGERPVDQLLPVLDAAEQFDGELGQVMTGEDVRHARIALRDRGQDGGRLGQRRRGEQFVELILSERHQASAEIAVMVAFDRRRRQRVAQSLRRQLRVRMDAEGRRDGRHSKLD